MTTQGDQLVRLRRIVTRSCLPMPRYQKLRVGDEERRRNCPEAISLDPRTSPLVAMRRGGCQSRHMALAETLRATGECLLAVNIPGCATRPRV